MKIRNGVRTATLCVLLLASACARSDGEPAPRADLAGIWDLVAVNGAPLPAPSPEEPSVLLQSVTMTLERSGEYTLASSYQVAGGATQQTTIGGRWEATDDALVFRNEQGPAVVEFGYSRSNGAIAMVDQELNEWRMRRR